MLKMFLLILLFEFQDNKDISDSRATAHQEAAEETGRWELVIHLIGGGNGVSRLCGDRGIRHEEAEYGRAVYCDATDYGHV